MKTKIIFLILLAILTTIAIFVACEKKPTQPEHTNVYDPNNPASSGDPFQLRVAIGNGGVTVTWTKPATPNLAGFKIYRSENETTGYSVLSTVNATTTQYLDHTVQNGHSYWYRIAAVDVKGNETSTTNVSTMNIRTDPLLVINSGDQYTSTKEVNLTILAITAQQMIISNFSDFSASNWESYTTSKNWTLLTGEGEKIVYMKIKYNDGTETPAISDTITPQPFDPSIVINNGDDYTLTMQVTLQLAAIGATEMNVSNSSFSQPEGKLVIGYELVKQQKKEVSNVKEIRAKANGKEYKSKKSDVKEKTKASGNWEPFVDNKNWELNTGSGTKTVYVKFKNDFEIESEVVFDEIAPQPINPSISIAGGAQYAPARIVDLILSANGINLKMKISEDSTFSSITWQQYLSPINFQLSTGDGVKKVYAIFKNDFEIESNTVNDLIILDSTPPTAVFTVTPDSGITNETTFLFDPTGSYDNLATPDEMQVRFDWENDDNWDTGWQQLSISGYQYSVGGGDKTVKMLLQDGAGWTADNTVQIFVNTRPVANFIAVQDTTNYALFHFNASTSFDFEDGTNLQYRWDFDDNGVWETGWLVEDTISYVYPYSGNFLPRISVRDLNNLSATVSIQLTVPLTVTDIDGNIYLCIKIGNQLWMAENLRVTHYNNGDALPNITNGGTWSGLSTGAYCNYGNDSSNAYIYGRLYNWYALEDNRSIAPVGWHVSTDAEWQTLIDYLGGASTAGGKIKDTTHWVSPNTGATNSSGFSAIPGGWRYGTGTFYDFGTFAFFWTSTESGSNPAWNYAIRNIYSSITRHQDNKEFGLSVRCVRD